MEDDEFYLNDDDLAEDNQLTILDLAMEKVVDSIIKTASAIKTNIKFNEHGDRSSNINILSSLTSALIELDSEVVNDLSDEEVQQMIENVLKQTTELTFANIDKVIKDDDDEEQTSNNDSDSFDDDTEDGSSLDF